MRRRSRNIGLFNLSMLDVVSGAMGAFLIIMVVLLPYYKKDHVDYRRQIEAVEARLAAAHAERDSLRRDGQRHRQRLLTQADSIRRLTDEARRAQSDAETVRRRAEQLQTDIERVKERLGFVIGKNAVFVIDVSGSMKEEDKIDEVRAGLKMLIAMMDETYRVDVVFFPNASATYGYQFGRLQSVTETLKVEVYNYLNALNADGGTPTEEVLEFVLARYDEADTIVLLSDGVPSPPSGRQRALSRTELQTIVRRTTQRNENRITINTIGVGEVFRQPGASSEARYFLERLAASNDGFYVGF